MEIELSTSKQSAISMKLSIINLLKLLTSTLELVYDFDMKIKSLFVLMCIPFLSYAAVPKNVAPQRQIGGQAGPGFSLLKIQHMAQEKTGQERIVFHIGTKEGFFLKGTPGYFNALNHNKKIVLDFSQMPTSKLSEKSIQEIFKSSRLIKKTRLIKDPIDQSLSVELELHHPARMKLIPIKGEKQTARLVLDINKK
jgi:hypothetical protein